MYFFDEVFLIWIPWEGIGVGSFLFVTDNTDYQFPFNLYLVKKFLILINQIIKK